MKTPTDAEANAFEVEPTLGNSPWSSQPHGDDAHYHQVKTKTKKQRDSNSDDQTDPNNQQEHDQQEEVHHDAHKCPNCGILLHQSHGYLHDEDHHDNHHHNWDEMLSQNQTLQNRVADLSSELIARDLEIASLRERCALLMTSVEQQDEIIAKIYAVAYPEPAASTCPSTLSATGSLVKHPSSVETAKHSCSIPKHGSPPQEPTNTRKRSSPPFNPIVGPAKQMLATHLDSMGFQCQQICEVLESLSEGLTGSDNDRGGAEVDLLNAALDRLLFPPVLQRNQAALLAESSDLELLECQQEVNTRSCRRRRHSYGGEVRDTNPAALGNGSTEEAQRGGDFANSTGFLRRPSRKVTGRLSVSDFGLLSEEVGSPLRSRSRSRKRRGQEGEDAGQERQENNEIQEDDQDDRASSTGSSGGSTMASLFAEIDEEDSRRQSRANSSTSLINENGEDKEEELSYTEFLERISLPGSRDLLDAIRRFVGSILGPRGDGSAPQSSDHVDYVFYGTHELRRRCQYFFETMYDTLAEHIIWRHVSESMLSKARDGIEKFVMDKIAHIAFSQLDECKKWQEDDVKLLRRMKLLSFVTPDMLDIKRCMRNEVVWSMAEDELRRINLCRCPGDKINCIVRCCSIIFSVLNLSRGGDLMESANRPGADDFLPVFIYVVLHSQIPALVSNCEYIAAYRNPSDLMSKAGYCFVNLRSAIEFINVLDASMLSVAEDEFNRLYKEAERAIA